jgi:hypothetical protein
MSVDAIIAIGCLIAIIAIILTGETGKPKL